MGLKQFIYSIIFLTCLLFSATAQDKRAQKLTTRIVRNLKTDSEKVYAIHKWIITHIRYDFKKEVSSNYSRISIKQILRHRKAICLGYSDLFKTLCSCAGINCVEIPGYNKDIYGNIGDHFYLDEHEWNAVYLNNEWKLVDVCWDAGNIKYTRRTFLGFFVYLFSHGKHDRVKFKPHFVQWPNYTYYLKSGIFFKTDHLPLNPIWQLTSPITSIQQFAIDSAYYYKKYNSGNDTSGRADELEIKRREYLSEEDSVRELSDGFVGYKFNYRNHYGIGQAYFELSRRKMPLIEKKPKDTVAILKRCDTVIKLLQKAQMESDSNVYYLMQQKEELTKNNLKKNTIFRTQQEDLNASTIEIIHKLKRIIYESRVDKSRAKRIASSINKRLREREKSKSFYFKKPRKISVPEDSIKYAGELKSINDSIKFYDAAISKKYGVVDSLYQANTKCSIAYNAALPGIIDEDYSISWCRLFYFDDLDYEIRQPKDNLMLSKFKNDSLLYNMKQFSFTQFFDELKKAEELLNVQFRNYSLKMHILIELKGSCMPSDSLDKKYEQNMKQMENSYNLLQMKLQNWASDFNVLRGNCKQMQASTKKEYKAFKRETRIERILYKVRNRHIISHTFGLLHANNVQFRSIPSRINKLSNYEKKLGKK